VLTKTDLKAIDKIVKKRIREEVEAESQNTKKELGSEMKMNLVRTIAELRELKDRLKNVEIDTRKIQKDLKHTVNFLDKEGLKITKRVDGTEKHLQLPSIS
jgi:uncharacterized protein YpuA (DUF1002 family)